MEPFVKLIPILFTLFLGVILRKLSVVKKSDAEMLLKLVFYVGLPAMLIKSFSSISLENINPILPISSAVVIGSNIVIAYLYSRFLIKPGEGRRINIIGASIMNNGFIIPFIDLFYGTKGLSYLFLLDFSNGVLAFSIVYYVASSANNKGVKSNLIKFFKTPPLIFLILSLMIVLFGIKLPSLVLDCADFLSTITIPLILISLGVMLDLSFKYFKVAMRVLMLRVLPGLFISLAIASLFDLEKSVRDVIIICSIAPIGFNLLTFATIEGLDVKQSSGIVSFSLLYGMIFIPMVVVVLQYF